jgi:hypothetical protein
VGCAARLISFRRQQFSSNLVCHFLNCSDAFRGGLGESRLLQGDTTGEQQGGYIILNRMILLIWSSERAQDCAKAVEHAFQYRKWKAKDLD